VSDDLQGTVHEVVSKYLNWAELVDADRYINGTTFAVAQMEDCQLHRLMQPALRAKPTVGLVAAAWPMPRMLQHCGAFLLRRIILTLS
jgi:hypothetical protein